MWEHRAACLYNRWRCFEIRGKYSGEAHPCNRPGIFFIRYGNGICVRQRNKRLPCMYFVCNAIEEILSFSAIDIVDQCGSGTLSDAASIGPAYTVADGHGRNVIQIRVKTKLEGLVAVIQKWHRFHNITSFPINYIMF